MTIFRNWKVKYFYNSLFAQYMKYSNVMLCHLIEFINFPYRKVERFIYRFCLLKNVIFFLWRWLFEVNIDDHFFYSCFNGNISDTHLKRKVFWSTNLPPCVNARFTSKATSSVKYWIEPLWEKCDKIIYYDVCLVFLHNKFKVYVGFHVFFFPSINLSYVRKFCHNTLTL